MPRFAMPLAFARESGVLACVDDAGRELVLHESRGRWGIYEWRVDPDGFTHAALRTSFTADELAACAQALASNGGRVAT